MTDPKLQVENLEELKKSNEPQDCVEEACQEKEKLDRLANLVRWVIAVPVVCFAILRTLAFFLG
jgi:cell division protein FtsX